MADKPKTLPEKVWADHVVVAGGTAEPDLIYIDLHLIHEVTTPQAFDGLRLAGRTVRRTDLTLATEDHNVPTVDIDKPIADPVSRAQVDALRRNCAEFGITLHSMGDPEQGIVHVVGPQLGLTQPGMTVVCGDSHTSTHGAFGALAMGIGTSEVEHVLATQTLVAKRSKRMLVRVEGQLGQEITAKDVALAIIGKIGTAGGTGYAIEFGGSAIRGLSLEGRMTLCNMAIEAGARAGLVAPDEKTAEYLRGRLYAPKGADWDKAVAYWNTLKSDHDAEFDAVVEFDAARIEPQVTWGTSPEQVLPIGARVPDPAKEADPQKRSGIERALQYMGLAAGTPLSGIKVDKVFIRCGRSQGQEEGGGRQTGAGRAGFRHRQTPGRGRRPGQDIHRRRLRMARTGLFDVPGNECGSPRTGRALRVHLQPQFRGPPGSRRTHPPGQSGNGCCRRRRRPLCRYP